MVNLLPNNDFSESSHLGIKTKRIAVEPDLMNVSVYAEPVHTHFPHVYHLICVWISSHIQFPACNHRLREESLVMMKFVAGPEFCYSCIIFF